MTNKKTIKMSVASIDQLTLERVSGGGRIGDWIYNNLGIYPDNPRGLPTHWPPPAGRQA
jgi:hypothetical protein